jgi:protoheme IX farnesyltransferase
MILVVFTAFVGMVLTPKTIDPLTSFYILLAITMGAGSAAAFNMWFDRDIDKEMERTKNRPIPLGIITPFEALLFGTITGVFSIIFMYSVSNYLSTILLLFTIIFYILIYTVWLKRTTSLNIVIGGAAGAIPPIIGWTAIIPEISFLPISLFLIIFFWTPPHFWALSVYRFNDYEKVKVPMLPNVSSIDDTKNQIIYYTAVLIALSYLPLFSSQVDLLYILICTPINILLILKAFKLKKSKEIKDQKNQEGLKFFGFTIFYLFALFSGLLVDNIMFI